MFPQDAIVTELKFFYSRNFRSPNQKTHHVILVFFWLRVSCSCFLFEQKTLFKGRTVSFREGCSLEFFCFSQIYLGMTSCFRLGHSAVTVAVFKPNPQKKLHNFQTPLLLALLFSFRHLKMQGKNTQQKRSHHAFANRNPKHIDNLTPLPTLHQMPRKTWTVALNIES